METLQSTWNYLVEAEHKLEHFLIVDNHIELVEAAPWVICSAIAWTVLHNLFHDQNKYAVSTFHSVSLSLVGFLNLAFLKHNKYEYLVFYFMAGYFLADFFINCLKPEFYIYTIHHILTVGATYRMINGRNWNETMFASSCWLLELSTPFLNHYKVHRTAKSALVFFVVFFLTRVLWLTRLSILGWDTAINRLEFGIIVLFTLLNYYWFIDIARMGYRKVQQEKKAKLEKEKAAKQN